MFGALKRALGFGSARVGVQGGEVVVNPTTAQHNLRNENRIKTLETAINNVQERISLGKIEAAKGRQLINGYKLELKRRRLIKRASEL